MAQVLIGAGGLVLGFQVWSLPVAGPNGRGVLHFQGKKDQGFWLLNGTLEAGGTAVNTRDCAQP